MEASALPAPAALVRSRLSIGASLLRLRSDEQLVALFRGGNEEAFRVIHDRYHQRLFAYARQMLPGPRQDAEDALQDIFVRAYSGLRASNRELALRAWLYRVAHNRCVDELRRPSPPAPELMEIVRPPEHDPIAEAERRESLRRLIKDIRRLPDQQRSALLMRELGGMAYADLAGALGVSVPAVKSLLVRARIGLAQAIEAHDTACWEIRQDLVVAHDRGVRPTGIARRHMHDCLACRQFRTEMRGTSRQIAALVPLGPLGLIANLFGFGSGAAGGGAAGSGAAGSGAAAAGGVVGTGGAVASIGAVAGGAATHVATIIAAAVVTAGGAVEIQRSVSSAPRALAAEVATAAPASAADAARNGAGNAILGSVGQPGGSTASNVPSADRQTASHAAAEAAAATAGPLLPPVDQVNPAAAATATTGTNGDGTTASPVAGTTSTDSSSGTGSTTTGTTPLTGGSSSPTGGTTSTLTGGGTTAGGSSTGDGSSTATATPATAGASGGGGSSATTTGTPTGAKTTGSQSSGAKSAPVASPAAAGPAPRAAGTVRKATSSKRVQSSSRHARHHHRR